MPDSKGSTPRAELRVTMPQELYDNLLKVAEADGRKVGDWIRRLILQEIGNHLPASVRSKKRHANANIKHRPSAAEWKKIKESGRKPFGSDRVIE